MLHLIFQSSVDESILQRIETGDDIVFHENTVFYLYQGSQLSNEVQNMLSKGINVYVLQNELECRGIAKEELIVGVNAIDYFGLVELTEKNKVVLTWR